MHEQFVILFNVKYLNAKVGRLKALCLIRSQLNNKIIQCSVFKELSYTWILWNNSTNKDYRTVHIIYILHVEVINL